MLTQTVIGETAAHTLRVERFNVIRELRRTGVTVILRGDVEWFVWRPRTETIVINPRFGPEFNRGTVTLALVHRALGHWGNTLAQDIDARDLTTRWLISAAEARQAAALVPRCGVAAVAASLQVTVHALHARLDPVCRCLTNLDIYHDKQCECLPRWSSDDEDRGVPRAWPGG